MSGCAHMDQDDFCASCAGEGAARDELAFASRAANKWLKRAEQAEAEVERLRARLVRLQDLHRDEHMRAEQAEARLAKVVEAAKEYRQLQEEAWGQGGDFVRLIVESGRRLDEVLAASPEPGQPEEKQG